MSLKMVISNHNSFKPKQSFIFILGSFSCDIKSFTGDRKYSLLETDETTQKYKKTNHKFQNKETKI